MEASSNSYALPIAARPPKTWFQLVHGVLALTVFLFGCVMVNATQLIFVLPLRLVPNQRVRELYEKGVRYTKGAFGMLTTLMCQLFAPTTIRVTFETGGIGAFSLDEIEKIVVRDVAGNVVALRLPKKLVIIANHQIYTDWWYTWCLTYFMDMHRDVLIVLKRSLKWVPVLGWGMQVFRFIFLARSWASDKHYLVSKLAKLGRKAQQEDTPLAFILYPEGTLVSEDTRPISKKFADKMGIPDMTHTLLPRSTGLHFALRALLPRVPSLKLLDITVAYPGIPPMGYGQAYYTIRSIFMDRVPPLSVHMHLRLIDIAADVPIGDLSSTNPSAIPPSRSSSFSKTANNTPPVDSVITPPTNGHAPENGAATEEKWRGRENVIETDVPEPERAVFDEWLRALWRVKDAKLEEFHQSAKGVRKGTVESKSGLDSGSEERKSFSSGAEAVEIPLKLRSLRDALDAFCFFGPAVVGWAWRRIRG
ncbi:hypothetical protein M0805_000434 [Coniferiporia weirii]|nr:hypothetical protein M0805_000434 [Coniferiporia weirii]